MLSVKAADCGLLFLIFALRFAVIAIPGNLLQTDPDGYLRLANALVESGVYGLIDEAGIPHATAFRPPLYPCLLAATIWCTGSASLWAIAGLHAALATLSAAFFLCIGRALQLRFMAVACLLLSIDPLLMRQSQLIMTETAATTVGLLSWWLLIYQEQHRCENPSTTRPLLPTWALTLLIGFSFGIATLTRPTAIVWLACVVAYFAVRSTTQRLIMLRQAAYLCVGLVMVLIPWIARNREHFGKSIWATTHGGYTLLLANNSILYDHFATGSVSRDWDEDQFHREWAKQKLAAAQRPDYIQRHREVVDDEFAQSVALATIQQRPLMFVWSAVVRIGWLWTPLPNPRPDSWIKWPITAWYIGLYALAITGAWYLGKNNLQPGWWLGWLLLISLTLVHAVYWSNMRMRAPALPLLYLLATYGAQSLIARAPSTHRIFPTTQPPPLNMDK